MAKPLTPMELEARAWVATMAAEYLREECACIPLSGRVRQEQKAREAARLRLADQLDADAVRLSRRAALERKQSP